MIGKPLRRTKNHKIEYAMISNRCMIAIASCANIAESKKPIAVPEMADRVGASASYIEQIFAKLKRARIVKGIRGPGGGYVLANDAKAISVLDIVIASSGKQRLSVETYSSPAISLLMLQIESVISEIGLSDLTTPKEDA